MKKAVQRDGKNIIYDTDRAKLLAHSSNDVSDMLLPTSYLYVTKNGNYFAYTLDKLNYIEDIKPLKDVSEAIEMFNKLPDKIVSYETAFPGIEFEDA